MKCFKEMIVYNLKKGNYDEALNIFIFSFKILGVKFILYIFFKNFEIAPKKQSFLLQFA